MGLANPEENQNAVKDLSGNIFIIQDGTNGGFMVYDPIADNAIEEVSTAVCPYIFDELHDNYYFGPMNYYYRIDDLFYHYEIGDYYTDLDGANELQNEFDSQLSDFRNITSNENYNEYIDNQYIGVLPPLGLQYSGEKTYINNYKYIKNMKYPINYDNSCGFVGASIVLNYWDKTVHSGVVGKEFLDENGELISTLYKDVNYNLKDKLITYNNNVADSTGKTVSNAVNKYCEEYKIHGSSSWYIGKIGLNTSLANERPAVMFGWFPKPYTNEHINHAVTCYGFDQRWWGGYYIVNYGWGIKYSEVSLGFGFVGETMTFSLNENEYRKNYVIMPSDYGFPGEYSKVNVEKNVTIGDLSFETNRLRCGYIENEYVNISPRKEGFDTAYLEYKFTNPINSMNINLSYWSDDERYGYPNSAIALIQYKDLYTDVWIDKLDILNNGNLSTNRYNQSLYYFTFPLKTREFRIYAHFNVISGQNDRNKGRISIGTININSYC